MSGTLQLDGLARPVDSVGGCLWGIDPSTKRVSVGVMAGVIAEARTLSLPGRAGFQSDESREAWWHAEACGNLMRFFRMVAAEFALPERVRLEEPFGGVMQKKGVKKARAPHPSSHRAFGVTLAALGLAVPGVPVEFCSPTEWKARALGKGHGFAQKPEIMEWARSTYGWPGAVEDEADALGIVTSLAVDLR